MSSTKQHPSLTSPSQPQKYQTRKKKMWRRGGSFRTAKYCAQLAHPVLLPKAAARKCHHQPQWRKPATWKTQQPQRTNNPKEPASPQNQQSHRTSNPTESAIPQNQQSHRVKQIQTRNKKRKRKRRKEEDEDEEQEVKKKRRKSSFRNLWKAKALLTQFQWPFRWSMLQWLLPGDRGFLVISLKKE